MNAIYSADRPAYFLINDATKLKEYEKLYYSGSSGKEFSIIAGQQVRLLDMGDRTTVDFIKEIAAANAPVPAGAGGGGGAAAGAGELPDCTNIIQALNASFPFRGGIQERFSSGDTKACDDLSIREICRIIRDVINPRYRAAIDGYYSHPQVNNNGSPSFHAEVGLCPAGFSKFRVSAKIKRSEPPKHSRNGGAGGAGAAGAPQRTLSRINGAPGGGGGLLGMFAAASPGGGGALSSGLAAAALSPLGGLPSPPQGQSTGAAGARKLGFGGGRRRTRKRRSAKSSYRRGGRRSRSGNGAN
jgi:hypothetical protein